MKKKKQKEFLISPSSFVWKNNLQK